VANARDFGVAPEVFVEDTVARFAIAAGLDTGAFDARGRDAIVDSFRAGALLFG